MARRKASNAREKSSGTKSLLRLSDPFAERRHGPVASVSQYIWVVVMSLGGIGVGVGVYAVVLRDPSLPSVAWANYVLAAGVSMVIAYLLFGQAAAATLHVGDLGVGFEEGGKVTRTAWWQIQSVGLDAGALLLKRKGKTLTIPVKSNDAAARHILAEASRRIPTRIELEDAAIERIGKADPSAGEQIVAEAPHVTGMECANSSQALTFEKDVRLCGRCGVPYHKAGIPARCVECNRRLKKA
jgi:hypothetical protein